MDDYEIGLPGDYKFRYTRTRLEDGWLDFNENSALSKDHALKRVEYWNKVRPDIWYFELVQESFLSKWEKVIMNMPISNPEDISNDMPWDDCKVAFHVEDTEVIWQAEIIHKLTLPDGWSLIETDCSGSRCVAIFRIEGILKISDGVNVRELLDKLEGI